MYVFRNGFERILLLFIDNFSERRHLRGGVYFVKALPVMSSDKVNRTQVQQMAIELYGQRNCKK